MNKDMPLMLTKLIRPNPRKNYIVRSEIFKKLRRIEDCKLTIIEGSAGSGKTTVISSYISESNIENVRWFALDENCNDIFMFWNYFVESVKEYLGERKNEFIEFFSGNIQKNSISSILTMLINNIDRSSDKYVVIDDFHLLTDEELLKSIEFFIENMPDELHIILVTREHPSIYLGSLYMEGNLLIIDQDDLNFNHNEEIKFLKETLKVNLDDEAIEKVCSICKGWVGGLQLISTAAAVRNNNEISKLDYSNRLLDDYITNEIFNNLSNEEQDFLVNTSILSYFNKDICDKYLEDVDFDDLFIKIQDKHLLITSVDETLGIFSYHRIIKDYLVDKFNKKSEEEKIKLYKKAADIFYGMSDYQECVNKYIAAKDYETAMDIIISKSDNINLSYFYNKIPIEEITKNPDFAYQCFFYYYVNLDGKSCEKIYKYVKEKLKDDKSFLAFKNVDFFYKGDFVAKDVDVLPLEEWDNMQLSDLTRSFLLVADSFILYYQGRSKEALEYIAKSKEYIRHCNNNYGRGYIYLAEAQINEELGNFKKALEAYKKLNEIKSIKEIYIASYYIGIAGVYIKMMELDKAYEVLSECKNHISPSLNTLCKAYNITLLQYFIAKGEKDNVDILLDELEEDVLTKLPQMGHILANYSQKFDNKELEDKYIELYKETNIENIDFYDKYAYILILNKNENNTDLGLLHELLKESRKKSNKFELIELDLLLIYILSKDINDENRCEIINLLKEAIESAYSEVIKLPFDLQKNNLIKLFKEIKIDILNELSREELDFIEDIIDFDKDKNEENNSLLTKREKEVLIELSKGKTNKEVAEHFTVSLSTIKTHINNIYSKLDVSNRVEAVNKAKELNELEMGN